MNTQAMFSDRLNHGDDEALIQRCLNGDEQAWSALIERYKKLIFSIPVKLGFSREHAADVFQVVCLTLLRELPHLREPRALPAWLIQMTGRKCFRWAQDQRRYTGIDSELDTADKAQTLPEKMMEELEHEQIIREAVNELSGECRRLIELLFYSSPPISYEETAKRMGLAKGSIGATRMRCLDKLQRSLERRHIR
ncbi:MAG TPA: sigma-70 family RNA polymerase sigma factor [Bryobacteraceae bacterium]|nr:sigma-70 family RNA polymerase sigma factor [Bryobacteraceae bacterium]